MRTVPLTSCALAALVGCGAAAPRVETAPPAATTTAPTFVPRLVRQQDVPEPFGGQITRAEGHARLVHTDAEGLTISDPDGQIVWLRERIADVAWAALDPTRTTVCMTRIEEEATHLAAFDVRTRAFVWERTLLPAGSPRHVLWGLATEEACAVVVREGTEDRVLVHALEDGAPIEVDVSSFTTGLGSEVFFDAATPVFAIAFPMGDGVQLDLRDAHTVGRIGILYASCIELDAQGRMRFDLDERVESPERIAYLEGAYANYLGACTRAPRSEGGLSFGDPWALLDGEAVAFHSDTGLYVFDPASGAGPRRIEGAPSPVHYRDVNGTMRTPELVVPPDATWVGVIRDDGVVSRFSVEDGSPLSEVPLPGPATDADDAEWQVFVGARGRWLVSRHVRDHRTIFVGDETGRFTRSRARALRSLYQFAEHEDARGTWLLTDTHYGVSRIDEATGNVVASFLPPPTWSRMSRAVVSPDGTEILVGIQGTSEEPTVLAFLDPETLAIAREVAPAPILRWTSDIEWREDGIVMQAAGAFSGNGWWVRVDPATGADTFLARGPARLLAHHGTRAGAHLDRSNVGGALFSRRHGELERWLRIVDDGEGVVGAAVLEPDGTGFCIAEGCAALRCITGVDEAADARDPACGALLR